MKINKVNVFTGIPKISSSELASIEKRQINLNSKPIKKTKQFLKSVWESNIEGANKIFDKLDGTSMARVADSDMNLDKFLSNFLKRNNIHAVLQIGSPREGQIILGVLYNSKDTDRFFTVTHFAWFECLLNKENYEIIRDIFKKSYEINL